MRAFAPIIAPIIARKSRAMRSWTEKPIAPLRLAGHGFFERGRRQAGSQEQLVGRRDRACERGKLA